MSQLASFIYLCFVALAETLTFLEGQFERNTNENCEHCFTKKTLAKQRWYLALGCEQELKE